MTTALAEFDITILYIVLALPLQIPQSFVAGNAEPQPGPIDYFPINLSLGILSSTILDSGKHSHHSVTPPRVSSFMLAPSSPSTMSSRCAVPRRPPPPPKWWSFTAPSQRKKPRIPLQDVFWVRKRFGLVLAIIVSFTPTRDVADNPGSSTTAYRPSHLSPF